MGDISIWVWIIGGIIIVGGVAALVVAGNRETSSGSDDDLLASRLEEFSERGEVASLEEIELSQPFYERVVVPFLLRVGEISTRFTPQHLIEETELKIELAGNPIRMAASTFLASRFVIAGALGGFLFVIFLFAPASSIEKINPYVVIPIFTVIGFFFPQLWLQSKIERRQKEIKKAMPDALDLLTICVEAGLGFDAAMAKVSEKWDNELSLSFSRSIKEVQLGKLRRDALKDMADRIGLAEMTSFIAAVIQSEQLGVSMAKVLRIQSEQMRIKRRQMAEEEAHKAPVKMIIPMAFLTFPSIFIVLLAPAVFSMMENFLGAGIG